MSICTRVIVAVAFQQVDRAPDAQASAQGNNQGLQNTYCRVEKCHFVYLQNFEILKGHFSYFSEPFILFLLFQAESPDRST